MQSMAIFIRFRVNRRQPREFGEDNLECSCLGSVASGVSVDLLPLRS